MVERGVKDEFLILACDGIWDVLENATAAAFIREDVLKYPDLGLLCESLLNHCVAKDVNNDPGTDNMTVCVVAFPAAPKLSEVVNLYTCYVAPFSLVS